MHPDRCIPVWLAEAGRLFQVREVNVLMALIVVGALISLYTPYFLTTNNLMGVFRAFSLTAIMSIGMVMVIITGGIDLSVGSAMGLASLVTALCFDAWVLPGGTASRGPRASGLVFGLVNGLLITVIGLAAVHRHARHAQHRAWPDVHDDAWRAGHAGNAGKPSRSWGRAISARCRCRS